MRSLTSEDVLGPPGSERRFAVAFTSAFAVMAGGIAALIGAFWLVAQVLPEVRWLVVVGVVAFVGWQIAVHEERRQALVAERERERAAYRVREVMGSEEIR